MRYRVALKITSTVTVEADTAEGAMEEAIAFTESLTAQPAYILGWNGGRAADEALNGRRIIATDELFVDSEPQVEADDAAR